jgi:uncharacterized protein
LPLGKGPVFPEDAVLSRRMHQPIKTPCVKVCVVDGQSNNCLGCGRTLGEIAQWARFSDDQRDAVMALLPARIEALKAAGKLG